MISLQTFYSWIIITYQYFYPYFLFNSYSLLLPIFPTSTKSSKPFRLIVSAILDVAISCCKSWGRKLLMSIVVNCLESCFESNTNLIFSGRLRLILEIGICLFLFFNATFFVAAGKNLICGIFCLGLIKSNNERPYIFAIMAVLSKSILPFPFSIDVYNASRNFVKCAISLREHL